MQKGMKGRQTGFGLLYVFDYMGLKKLRWHDNDPKAR